MKLSIKILYVSDDPDDIFFLRMMTEEAGFRNLDTLSPRGESRAVLDHLLKGFRSQLPDIILVDAHIPPLDSFQILELIRAHAPLSRIPVVLVSGSKDHLDSLGEKHPGIEADGFLPKPIRVEELEGICMSVHEYESQIEP